MKKLIDLDIGIVETLTIKAVKERTTFKQMVEKILIKIARDYDRNL
jgi:hypothetical protein